MTQSSPAIDKDRAFIDARFSQSRIIREQATSTPTPFSKGPTQLQVRTDTSSGFAVGLDNTETPTEFIVEIDYKVDLTLQETNKPVATYEAKHAVQFVIRGWSGFTQWKDVPAQALSPYFAVAQNLAIVRAENSLAAMGLRGLPLPRQIDFENPATPASQEAAAV